MGPAGVITGRLAMYVPTEAIEEDGGKAYAVGAFRRSLSGRALREDTVHEAQDPAVSRTPICKDPVTDEWEYVTTANGLPTTGWIMTFEAETDEAITDADADVLDHGRPTHGFPERGPAFALPEHITAQGGMVRVRHGLNTPVTVFAYGADGERRGYLFAQPLTDDEEHVELLPGATHLTVTPDRLIEG